MLSEAGPNRQDQAAAVGEKRPGAGASEPTRKPAELLANLPGLNSWELAAVWRSVTSTEPPKVPDNLLRQLIAYQVQIHHHGGLRPALERELRRAGQELGNQGSAQLGMRPGTRLIREWRGRTINVQVRERDFVWEGRAYRSLSRIANEVTGARWSGPRFFGLAGNG